jgi:PHP family Zn ribbon phosphoesterase
LLDNGVRVEVREARKRGVEVTINDEAGLDAIDPEELDSIRDSIAKAIRATQSGKIAIRAPKGESYLVSIIATRPEANSPDLWLRLP